MRVLETMIAVGARTPCQTVQPVPLQTAVTTSASAHWEPVARRARTIALAFSAGAKLTIASATQGSSTAPAPRECFATIWIVRASQAARSLRSIRAPARALCQPLDAGSAA